MLSTANAANEPLKIRSVFDINSAFCAIKNNDSLGMDNRDSAASGRDFGSSSTNAMLVLANGENEITVEIGTLGWFSKAKLSNEERKIFHPDVGRKVDLTAFQDDESAVLGRIRIGINKDGIHFAKPDEEKSHKSRKKSHQKNNCSEN